MIVRVRPDRVPDTCPQALVTVIVPRAVAVVMPGAVFMTEGVLLTGVVLMAVAVLAAHDSSMTRKTRCGISTSASRAPLRIARNCGAGG
jgi:hypothetical protein